MENGTKLYPSAPPLISNDLVLKENIRREQYNHMMTKIDSIKRDMLHYKKIKNKYNICHAIVKYFSLGVIGLSEVSSFVILSLISGGINIPFVFLYVTIGVGTFKVVMIPISKLSFNRKKKHYKKKYQFAKEFLDSITYFVMKANSDGFISEQEQLQFRNMIEAYREKVDGSLNIDYEKVKREVVKDIKKNKNKFFDMKHVIDMINNK